MAVTGPSPALSDDDFNDFVDSPTESGDDRPIDFIKTNSVVKLVGNIQKVQPKERQAKVIWRKAKGGQPKASLRDWGNSILFTSLVLPVKNWNQSNKASWWKGACGNIKTARRYWFVESFKLGLSLLFVQHSRNFLPAGMCMYICLYYYYFLCRQA